MQLRYRALMEKSKNSAGEEGRVRTPFGERLFFARRRKGMTQREVAMHVGISASNLAELESTGVGSAFTVALAMLYKVNPVWLAYGKGPITGGRPEPEWLEPLGPDEMKIVQTFVDGLAALGPDDIEMIRRFIEGLVAARHSKPAADPAKPSRAGRKPARDGKS
ncbi:helix-turn-helix transcriptional regulator [Burkholderia cenocepacia]|uniref:helix-turn-helix domain-containing protein n=1 Tax=Burkholderia cenocepacia TaxID=95486 RepID=UPI0021AB2804|nr:helix-turn-helix transcriptional regulator [Burkholderia cenocepacia]